MIASFSCFTFRVLVKAFNGFESACFHGFPPVIQKLIEGIKYLPLEILKGLG